MDIHTITLDGTNVEYTLRRSKRAKYPQIRVDVRNGVTLVLPNGYPDKFIRDIFREKKNWLLEKLDCLDKQRRKLPNRKFISGELFPYLGKMYPLEISSNGNREATVSLGNTKLHIELRDNVPSNPELIRALLERWYRFRARAEIEVRIQKMAADMNLTYNRIAIRDQKTRWGSCSAQGNLNFNYRLMLAPSEILEYIILHELTHLHELKHTPLFWALVESRDPDYKRKDKWLRANGYKLVL